MYATIGNAQFLIDLRNNLPNNKIIKIKKYFFYLFASKMVF